MKHPRALTPQQQRVVDRLQTVATLMDSQFAIPGIGYRIGWDGLIGLIPGVGDLASTAISLYIISEAQKLGVSRWTTARMVGNVAIDAVVGAIPVLGDLFDMAYKANLRNLRLLGIEPRTSAPADSAGPTR